MPLPLDAATGTLIDGHAVFDALVELGHDASVVGIARLYAPIASALVIDPLDADLADRIEAEGLTCVVTPSVMSDPVVARELARATLAAVSVV